jgi:cysteine desulfurase / selenocysteine lyase
MISPTLRNDFPILQREVNGKRLVYLDNAATSQKPRQVLDAERAFYEHSNANVHRSAHTLAVEADAAFQGAREDVARFVGANRTEEVIFTRGTTDGLNLVAYGWGLANLVKDDEILVSEMEHHSNLVPWHLVARLTGARVKAVPMRDDGTLDLEEYRALLGPRTRLVSVVHMSNVLGTVNPVTRIAELAHEAGAVVVIDGAQSVPHMPVEVRTLGGDFVAFSGHKMLGPTGIGALWGKYELLRAMNPFEGGGSMISEVYTDRSTYAVPPHKFEAGTPNIAQAVGLAAAISYLEELGMPAVWEHERELARLAIERMAGVPGVTIYGPRQGRGGTIAFNLEGVHPHDLSTALDSEGVAIRAGHHCAQPLHRRFGLQSTARASFYVYNVEEEIDLLVQALYKAREFFVDVLG